MNRTAPGHTSEQGHPTALREEAKARPPIHATLQAIFGAMGRGFGPAPARGALSPSRGRSQRLLPEAPPAEGERHPAASWLALGERRPTPQPQTRSLAQTETWALTGARPQYPSQAQLPPPRPKPQPPKADQDQFRPLQPHLQPQADWHAYTRQQLFAAWLGRPLEPRGKALSPTAAPLAASPTDRTTGPGLVAPGAPRKLAPPAQDAQPGRRTPPAPPSRPATAQGPRRPSSARRPFISPFSPL